MSEREFKSNSIEVKRTMTYESDEDLEQINLIIDRNSQKSSSSHTQLSNLGLDKPKQVKLNDLNDNFEKICVTSLFSQSILLMGLASLLIYSILDQNVIYVTIKSVEFQTSHYFLIAIWFFLTTSLICCLSRHAYVYHHRDKSIYTKKKEGLLQESKKIRYFDEKIEEERKLIARQLGWMYSATNFLITGFIISFYFDLMGKYLARLLLGLSALIVASFTYHRIEKGCRALSGIQNRDWARLLCYDFPISFSLASNCCLLLTSVIQTISYYPEIFTETYIDKISIVLNCLLFFSVITILAYLNDFAFVFIVLLFEVGIVLHNDMNINYQFYFVLITLACFIWSFIASFFVERRDKDKEELDELQKYYINEQSLAK